MKQFLILFFVAFARAGPVVVEPIVPEVPVVVKEAVVVPKADVVVPVVPKENVIPVVEKKEDVVAVAPVVPVEDVAVAGENVQDPQLLLSDPIDKATKLIIDLDDHLRKYLPAEDEVATTLAPAIAYAGGEAVAEIEPTPAERQNQMTALIDQVNRLAESIENTITDLVARRRYVTAAMLRSMLNYVRRVRVNLERLQNRLQSVQAVASVGQNQNAPPAAPAPIPGTAFFNTIRDRINRITEEIGALVSRIRGSFTPGGPSGSPLPPLATSAPLVNAAAIADVAIVSA